MSKKLFMAIIGALGLASFDAKAEAELDPVSGLFPCPFSTGHTVGSS
ncbi:MAG: hypothetical protein JRE45_17405 [Deltaproteobacteria bacterium]|nr:hypothetical protein [Deltaproteobacteria bacterium]MBW2161097.1 hypothetical protein [Deltaproteobacteria bacterium]MBW2587310.1 hypothetical protein [Deltaproteobacteria bacterium]MBW2629375.1 hypothetical protein [Deltaproteobacteria bacterium]